MISSTALATRYAAYVHAELLGDEIEAIDFGRWLDGQWCDWPAPPDVPCGDDATAHAEPGTDVIWIERDDEIVGLLAGRARGCYRIPLDANPPAVALYLDDVDGCSTGSVMQERAFLPQQAGTVFGALLERVIPLEIGKPPATAPARIPHHPMVIEILPDHAYGGSPG